MVQIMEAKYGKANRVWVMDRGMVSEKNLEYMRKTGARYLVGTPKSMLKKFEQCFLDQGWEEVQPGVDIKIYRSPEGVDETFVFCRSQSRKEKENAILNRFVNRLEIKLRNLAHQAEAGRTRDRQKVERRIGRLLEQNSRAASLFNIIVTEHKTGKVPRLFIDVHKNEARLQWAMDIGGSYILRTNWLESDPRTLWDTYIKLTEVEDSFRTEKHDLGMRPIFHHKPERTHAHILVCFLALTMWRTFQLWMKASGLGTAPRKLLEELRELKSLDVLLPTREKILRLRVVATPSKELKVLLQRLKILLPNKPKVIENVVKKMA
jgi:transposase